MMWGSLWVLLEPVEGSARKGTDPCWLSGWRRRSSACGLQLKKPRYKIHEISVVFERRRVT